MHPPFKFIEQSFDAHGVDVVVRHNVVAKEQNWDLHQRCGCPVISYTSRSIDWAWCKSLDIVLKVTTGPQAHRQWQEFGCDT